MDSYSSLSVILAHSRTGASNTPKDGGNSKVCQPHSDEQADIGAGAPARIDRNQFGL
jgi:hypothetical protein